MKMRLWLKRKRSRLDGHVSYPLSCVWARWIFPLPTPHRFHFAGTYFFQTSSLHPFLLAIRPSQKFSFPSLQYQHCQYPRLLTISLVCRSHYQCGISHSHPSPIPLFPSCHAISPSHAKATGTAQNPGKRGGNRLIRGHVLNAIVWSIICRMLVN